MGKRTVTSYYCDVCEKQTTKENEINIQCIFITEQTEGKPVNPYLSNQNIYLCFSCLNEVLKGNYIFARGAMGYNTYYFKENK